MGFSIKFGTDLSVYLLVRPHLPSLGAGRVEKPEDYDKSDPPTVNHSSRSHSPPTIQEHNCKLTNCIHTRLIRNKKGPPLSPNAFPVDIQTKINALSEKIMLIPFSNCSIFGQNFHDKDFQTLQSNPINNSIYPNLTSSRLRDFLLTEDQIQEYDVQIPIHT